MALLLAVIIWALGVMTVYYVYNDATWLPEAWSAGAAAYDRQFMLTTIIVGVAFIAAQLLLGWFVFRYRARGNERARYIHGSTFIEVGGIVVTSVVFIGLAILGQRLWAQVHLTSSPPGTLQIEITGQQFQWNVRYPGPDGEFGRTSPALYEPAVNDVGIFPDDPAGRDDLVLINQLVVPVNRPVELTLRSKDVLHSFFLPTLRIKQDTVPGLAIPLRFTANRTGKFEIACAELCGAGHYRMKAYLEILEPEAYEQWLAEQEPASEYFAPAEETPATEDASHETES